MVGSLGDRRNIRGGEMGTGHVAHVFDSCPTHRVTLRMNDPVFAKDECLLSDQQWTLLVD